ncbi:MAG: hypothetical protein L0211_12610 [Planctomycetaceae bacterium]|nr:hypothetical protein [Planctomycetaceae bacterium]
MSVIRGTVWASAACSLLLIAGSASAQRERKPNAVPAPADAVRPQAEAPTIVGKVAAYEADKSITVEVKMRGGKSRQTEFSIVKDQTKIELLGDAKEIAVGLPVSVWAGKDNPKSATRIVAGANNARPQPGNRPNRNPPNANPSNPAEQPRAAQQPMGRGQSKGKLKGLDVAKNTVTVTTSNRATGKVETTYELAKDVVVLRDGKPAKISDLKQGGSITFKLSPDQKTAVGISETGKTLMAPLKSVDPEKNSITLTVTTGGRNAPPEKKDVTHELAKDGKVTLEDKEVKLAELKDVRPGSNIQLTFSVDDENKLVHIHYAPSRR